MNLIAKSHENKGPESKYMGVEGRGKLQIKNCQKQAKNILPLNDLIIKNYHHVGLYGDC